MSDNVADSATEAKTRAGHLSPVALAFMGDAVYETLVRNYLISVLRLNSAKIHKACVGFVKASEQARAVRLILPILTDEERTILRRGRNANTTHVPKNAAPSDYRYATGLEALFGYLYLCGREARIGEIFSDITENLHADITEAPCEDDSEG
jgi:ribonuclease-3 family protein